MSANLVSAIVIDEIAARLSYRSARCDLGGQACRAGDFNDSETVCGAVRKSCAWQKRGIGSSTTLRESRSR